MIVKANHSAFRTPESLQTINHAPMFASGSTNILPFSPQGQQAIVSGLLAVVGLLIFYLQSSGFCMVLMYLQGQSQDISQIEPQTQAAYKSQNFD